MPTTNGNVKTGKITLQGKGTVGKDITMQVINDEFTMKMGADVLLTVASDNAFNTDDTNTESKIIISKDTKFEGNVEVDGVITVNQMKGIKETNTVGLYSEVLTKNFAEANIHNIQSSGFKMKKGNDTFVVTSAHNLYEVQHVPYEYGIQHRQFLPRSMQGTVDTTTVNYGYGDGDILIIGDEGEEPRQILATSQQSGVGFWDITRSCGSSGTSTLIDFFPRQSGSDERENYGNNPWVQVVFNKKSKFCYQQSGEMSGADPIKGKSTKTDIFDCSRAHYNEIKLVSKFSDKFNVNHPGHVNLLKNLYEEVYSLTKNTDGTQKYISYDAWIQTEKVFGKEVLIGCHTTKIDSDNQLMMVHGSYTGYLGTVPSTHIAANTPTIQTRVRWGQVVIYDIHPQKINPLTNLPCSVSPLYLCILGANQVQKVLTDTERQKIIDKKVEYDESGHMKLEMPINDPNRPTITMTATGALPKSFAPENRHSRDNYSHDGWPLTVGGKSYYYSCKETTNWFTNPSSLNNIWLVGYSMGEVMIYDTTGLREKVEAVNYNFTQSLVCYQTPIHKGFDADVPLDAYSHNVIPSFDGKVLYLGCENPSGNRHNANINYQTQSIVTIFDLTDLTNIKFVKQIGNFSKVKAVTEANIKKFTNDANHNFHTISYKGNNYLGFADYVDGVHIFNINNPLDPVYVGHANPMERVQASNPYYGTDISNSMYPFTVEEGGSNFAGVWGLVFGSDGEVVVFNSETIGIYSMRSFPQTKLTAPPSDIRDYVNPTTKQPYTKYPYLKTVDSIKGYDFDSKKIVKFDLVGMDRHLDIAVLKPSTGFSLSGGITLASSVSVGEECVMMTGNGGNSFAASKGFVCNTNKCISPQIVVNYYRASTLIKSSSGQRGGIEQVNDKGTFQDNTKANYASLCSIGLPSLVSSCVATKGSSGAPLLTMDNKLLGMVSHKMTDGFDGYGIVIRGDVVASIATKIIDKNLKIAYAGLNFIQDVMLFEGYLINTVDVKGPAATKVADAVKAYAGPALVTGETLVWELFSVNDIEVGPTKTSVVELIINSAVGATVKCVVRPMKRFVTLGVTNYTRIDIASTTLEFNLAQRPEVLDYVDEKVSAPNMGNFYPKYTWFWEEMVGFCI